MSVSCLPEKISSSRVENPNHSEETATRWVLPPTQPFPFDGKFKLFRVGHLYSAIGKFKPLGELQRDESHPLLGLYTPIGNPNHLESDTSTSLSGNPNGSYPYWLFHSEGKSNHSESDTSTPLSENSNHSGNCNEMSLTPYSAFTLR